MIENIGTKIKWARQHFIKILLIYVFISVITIVYGFVKYGDIPSNGGGIVGHLPPTLKILAWGVVVAPILGFVIMPILIVLDNRRIYYTYPTAIEYKNAYCSDTDGIKCCNCGSSQIWSYRHNIGFDNRNLHQCHQCQAWLYRT